MRTKTLTALALLFMAITIAGCGGGSALDDSDPFDDPYGVFGDRYGWTRPGDMPLTGTARYDGNWTGTLGGSNEQGRVAARFHFSPGTGSLDFNQHIFGEGTRTLRSYAVGINGNEFSGGGVQGHFEGADASKIEGDVYDTTGGVTFDADFFAFQ